MPRTFGRFSPRRPLRGRRKEKTRPAYFLSSPKRCGRNRLRRSRRQGDNFVQSLRRYCRTDPRPETRSTARCTTALSSNRMQERIFFRYAGGAFHSAEIGRTAPPFSSGWKIRSSHRRQPIGYSGLVRNHIEQGSRARFAWCGCSLVRYTAASADHDEHDCGTMTVVTADAGSLCYTLFDAFSTVCS